MKLSEDTLDTLAGVVEIDRPVGAYELARRLNRPRAWETSRQLIVLHRHELVAQHPGPRHPVYTATEAGNLALWDALPASMRGAA